jgi:hypothetical protein
VTWPPKQPRREEIADEDLVHYDAVIDRRLLRNPDARTDAGYYGRLLNSPEMAAALSRFGSMARLRGERGDSYAHADREFVDQVLSVDLGTNAVQRTHIPDAVASGVRLEAIEALRTGHEEALTNDERMLAEFIRAVVNGRMTASVWEAVEARMGARGVIEYAIFTLFLHLTMRLNQAVGLTGPDDDAIEEMLRDLAAGNVDVDGFRARLG